MNLSDLGLSALARPPASPTQAPADAPLDAQALIAQLGSEVAGTLSSALERVATLAATGRISSSSLRALREELDLARRAGIVGQQVVRLGSGHVALASERVDLTALLREALLQRGREIAARGIEVRQVFEAAEVRSDATLLFSLLQGLLDWSFEHAVSRIDLTLVIRKQWPAPARLTLSFAHCPPDEVDHDAPAGGEEDVLNTMSWRLVQQTARVLGLPLQRRDAAGKTELAIEFGETLAPQLMPEPEPAPLVATQAEATPAPTPDLQPLAGRHVLVVAARREIRNVVRQALRPLGLKLDMVTTVAEAQQLCTDALPHALIFEAGLGGEHLDRLRADLLRDGAPVAFVQIVAQGRAFEVLNVGGQQVASVGRDAVIHSLPTALKFELSRHA